MSYKHLRYFCTLADFQLQLTDLISCIQMHTYTPLITILCKMPISQPFYFPSTNFDIFMTQQTHTLARIYNVYVVYGVFCERICDMFLNTKLFYSDYAESESNFDITKTFVWLKSQAQ